MIIDIHTHTFPDKIAAAALGKLIEKGHSKPFSDGTVSGLLAQRRRSGVDLSVILPVATAPRQVVHINDSSAGINETFSGEGLFSFGCMHPDFEDYRNELARIRTLGLKGIKLHPIYQETDIDDIRFLRILDRAAELGLIVIAHAGYDVGYPGVVHCSPAMIRHALSEVGSFPFIAAHMGGWHCWDEALRELAGTGIYLDTAVSIGQLHTIGDGFYTEEDLYTLNAAQIREFCNAFGSGHILFGSDSPWTDPADDMAELRKMGLLQEELEGILGGNAARLLGL